MQTEIRRVSLFSYSTVFIQDHNSSTVATSLVHPYEASEALPLQEQVESLVDLLQADLMRDQPLQLQLLHAFPQTPHQPI